jgi:hypothetical protein
MFLIKLKLGRGSGAVIRVTLAYAPANKNCLRMEIINWWNL